ARAAPPVRRADTSSRRSAHIHRRDLDLAPACRLRTRVTFQRLALLAACHLSGNRATVLVSRRPSLSEPAQLVHLDIDPVLDSRRLVEHGSLGFAYVLFAA